MRFGIRLNWLKQTWCIGVNLKGYYYFSFALEVFTKAIVCIDLDYMLFISSMRCSSHERAESVGTGTCIIPYINSSCEVRDEFELVSSSVGRRLRNWKVAPAYLVWGRSDKADKISGQLG